MSVCKTRNRSVKFERQEEGKKVVFELDVREELWIPSPTHTNRH